MTSKSTHHHLLYRVVMFCLSIFFIMPVTSSAQDNALPRLELRPHCEEQTQCPSFDVRDPMSMRTPALADGEVLDVDLVMHNPAQVPIQRFRIWMAYDPLLLQGKELVVTENFPTPTPGENVFVNEEGMVKLSGTALTPNNDDVVVLARLSFTVNTANIDGTPITFFEDPESPEAEIGVFTGTGPVEQNLISTAPGYLYVQFTPTEQASSSATSSVISDPMTGSSSSEATQTPVESNTIFALLQVQGLRVTTEGSTVYLAWDTLPSSEIIGYNLYYGTVSGQYIQRHSIDAAANSTAIRSLPVDATYYFAIRGVNALQEETDFSREVAVSVGNPRTSTAPFVANTLPTPTPDTDGFVSGETGINSTLAILLLISAAIGTYAAIKRQLVAQPSHSHS